MNILVTGSKGFIGKNLIAELKNKGYTSIFEYDIDTPSSLLEEYSQKADFIFHLAGVNRPKETSEFMEGNFGFTSQLLDLLKKYENKAPIMVSSSTQAELENLYGQSKKAGEDLLINYSLVTSNLVHIYRFPNVFGKWSQPNYNTVVATFCYNIARDLPIQINNPEAHLNLVYIDDVVKELISLLENSEKLIANRDVSFNSFVNTRLNANDIGDSRCNSVVDEKRDYQRSSVDEEQQKSVFHNSDSLIGEDRCLSVAKTVFYREVYPIHYITLGELADLLYSFKDSRNTKEISDMSDPLTKKLYSTYLSFLPENEFSYDLKMNIDPRGSFTEFLKSPDRGQVSVNISKPGITKGNHWHHTKNEKFLVVSGNGVIRFRKVLPMLVSSEEIIANRNIIEYFVSGEKLQVVDIPPGYTHNIENLGDTDMVTIMWANEAFDPDNPDTIFEQV